MTAAVPRGHLAALGILVAMVTLSGVWASSLQGCDEAYYAHMARGMLESGDFLVPRYDGTPPLDKPPLLMWLVAASFRFFGVGDVQARLPVLLLGAAVPFAVWWGIPQTAAFRFVAASTLATTLLYVQLQHMVMTDLVAFVGLLGLVVGLLRAAEGERWGWVAGSGLGVAALAKGPLAALFVLATLPYAVRHREELLRSGFLARAIPGILPAAAWYGLVWREFGQKFVDVHFGVFLFRLAAQGIAAESPLGPAFYLVSALWRFLPWWPLLPAALVAGWGAARAKDRTAEWSVGFAAVYFTAITAMRTKTDHYALPLVLPAALLVAGWVTGGGGFRTAESLSAVLCRVLGGLLAFGGAGGRRRTPPSAAAAAPARSGPQPPGGVGRGPLREPRTWWGTSGGVVFRALAGGPGVRGGRRGVASVGCGAGPADRGQGFAGGRSGGVRGRAASQPELLPVLGPALPLGPSSAGDLACRVPVCAPGLVRGADGRAGPERSGPRGGAVRLGTGAPPVARPGSRAGAGLAIGHRRPLPV